MVKCVAIDVVMAVTNHIKMAGSGAGPIVEEAGLWESGAILTLKNKRETTSHVVQIGIVMTETSTA
jgi:hypothetical protein